jgi:glutathione S-transferase
MSAASDSYRVFGSDLSPYSVKVRSYCRYKGIPHEWILRDASNMDEFQKYAKLPLIPLVVGPGEEALQDSTPIIEKLEARFPEPRLDPEDPALAFLSALLEEFGDEWGNKWMFHYRWTYEPDQDSAADRIARSNIPDPEAAAKMAPKIKERMVPRLSFVGSNEVTRDQIEGSFRRALETLESHLSERPFLFGGRPCMGDLGMFAQLHQCLTDPTPGAILRGSFPNVVAWIERMLSPEGQGDFEEREKIVAGLRGLLADEVGGLFLPWSTANARALAEGRDEFEVELEGRPFRQQPQKYHAKSLKALRSRYEAVSDRSALDPILEDTGCRVWLGS